MAPHNEIFQRIYPTWSKNGNNRSWCNALFHLLSLHLIGMQIVYHIVTRKVLYIYDYILRKTKKKEDKERAKKKKKAPKKWEKFKITLHRLEKQTKREISLFSRSSSWQANSWGYSWVSLAKPKSTQHPLPPQTGLENGRKIAKQGMKKGTGERQKIKREGTEKKKL